MADHSNPRGREEPVAGRLVQQVPLFFGLKPADTRAFLEICHAGIHPQGEVLCEYRAASNRLFILLEGGLDVLSPNGEQLASLRPVTTVGEMGFICRRPRSATVRVRETSRLLRVEHHDFEVLVEQRPELASRIYRNLVRILADRLGDANDLIARYRAQYEQAQASESGEPAVPAAGVAPATPVDTERQATGLLEQFYALAEIEADTAQRAEDRGLMAQLQRDGYSGADIEYAIKWTVRNIPGAKRFNLVRLSIREAFEDRWRA